MKKIFYSLLAIGTLLFTSCEDENKVFLNQDVNTTTDLNITQTGSVVLNKDTPDDVAVNLSWNEPDFGFNAVPSYSILIDLATGDFSNAQTIEVKSDLMLDLTHVRLNSITQELGIDPNTPTNLGFKLEGKIGEKTAISSEVKTLEITSFSSILNLSTSWGVVGSAANNWGATPDLPFFKTSTANVLVAYVTLIDGEIKFRENNDWANNFGDDGADGTLESGGANIAVTAGNYKITLNFNNNTYAIETFSWGLVGDATPNGWGGPDVPLVYDQYSDQFRAIVALKDGEMKIRLNNDWGSNFGDDDANGTLDSGGANIPVTAGNYIVSVNFNDNTYTLESIPNIWGLVGDATPNGWGGPDLQLNRDWSKPDDNIWIVTADLTAGEFKFRADNDWALNYGDDGVDGNLDAGGANIATTAGNFTITLNLTDTSNPTYTKVEN